MTQCKLGKPSGTHPNTYTHIQHTCTNMHGCTHTHTHTLHTHMHTLPVLQYCHHIGTSPTSWTDQLQSVTINDFTSIVGPTTDIPKLPIDVFELFFSDDLQEEKKQPLCQASDGRPTIPVVDTHHCGKAKSFLWLFYLDGHEPSAITRGLLESRSTTAVQ